MSYKIEFPDLKETICDHVENKLLRLTDEGSEIYRFLKEMVKWKNKYNIKETNGYFWIEELKGIKFDKKEEAEMYCFLDCCEKRVF